MKHEGNGLVTTDVGEFKEMFPCLTEGEYSLFVRMIALQLFSYQMKKKKLTSFSSFNNANFTGKIFHSFFFFFLGGSYDNY